MLQFCYNSIKKMLQLTKDGKYNIMESSVLGGKMKEKKIQIIINIVTTINIVLIIILIYNIIISNKYSRKLVLELAEQNSKTFNYMMVKESYSIEDGITSKIKVTQSENARIEEDLETGYTMLYYNDFRIDQENKTYSEFIGQNVEKDGKEADIKITTQEVISWHPLENEFESFKHINSSPGYKYIKTEEYNGAKCIVVEFSFEEYGESVKVWFNFENGLIEKEENYKDETLKSVVTYEIEVNNVTDAELCIPDLEDYTYIGQIKIYPDRIE